MTTQFYKQKATNSVYQTKTIKEGKLKKLGQSYRRKSKFCALIKALNLFKEELL